MGLNPSALPTFGSGWRGATLCHPRKPCGLTRGLPTGAEAPSDASCSTSRGLTGQGPRGFRHPAPPVWRSRVRDAWPAGRAREHTRDESFAPTRSARTPLVARSRCTRWRVGCNAASGHPAEASWTWRPPTIPPRETPPTRANARAWCSRAPVHRSLSRGAGVSQGARAASPGPPRRGSRSAAPEVPSVEEPPERAKSGFRPGCAGQVRLSPQVVTNCGERTAPLPSRADSHSVPAALTGRRRRELGLHGRPVGPEPAERPRGTGFDPRSHTVVTATPRVLPR